MSTREVLYITCSLFSTHMGEDLKASDFDSSRAELFEALGHPVRMKILEFLGKAPLGFSELKKKVGIESSGHL